MSEDGVMLPSYAVQRKVRRIAGSADELIARAQRIVQHHTDLSRDRLEASLAAAEQACAGRDATAGAVASAGEIEACASLLGFTSVAQVARSLRMVGRYGASGANEQIVRLHVEAMRLLYRERLRDPDDPATRALISGLAGATAKLSRADLIPA